MKKNQIGGEGSFVNRERPMNRPQRRIRISHVKHPGDPQRPEGWIQNNNVSATITIELVDDFLQWSGLENEFASPPCDFPIHVDCMDLTQAVTVEKRTLVGLP